MRLPARPRGSALKFNITPMIDVVFNLIIFFLVASHFARSESTAEIQLPLASDAQADNDSVANRLTITLLANGESQLGPTSQPIDDILQQIGEAAHEHGADDLEVRIRTDRKVRYGRLEPILTTCAKHGIARVRFAVLAE